MNLPGDNPPSPKAWFSAWAGWPTAILLWITLLSLGGCLGAVVSSGLAPIPIIGLVALLFVPFVWLAAYLVPALGLSLLLRALLPRIMPVRAAQMLAPVAALAVVIASGFALPQLWNEGAGLQAAPEDALPPPVQVPAGAEIALIGDGLAEYAECTSFCLTMLLEGRVRAVLVARVTPEPMLATVLPGKRFRLRADTQACLRRQQRFDWPGDTADQRRDFLRTLTLPRELEACLDVATTRIDQRAQATLVEWTRNDQPADAHQAGYTALAVIRTVVPAAGGPIVNEARRRGGWRYGAPLLVSPYAGNAGSGGYFSISVPPDYFEEPGFPDYDTPLFWRLTAGSDALGERLRLWIEANVPKQER